MSEPRTLITIDEGAERLVVCTRTLRNLIARGELTAYRIAGTRSIRLDASELDALLRPIPTAGRAS